jgi:endonuclease/exonuclease/phosphatase family metal-dependent hydrolase
LVRYFVFLLVGLSLTACSMSLSRWRETVGPALVYEPPVRQSSSGSPGRLIVVNWNVHVGAGDVARAVETIMKREQTSGFGAPEFVFLLQESFRRGAEIPSVVGAGVPRRIAPPGLAFDIEDIARNLGWWMYYAPSMRNGARSGDEAEDRGNAILSSLPLENVQALELPFVLQRRVALMATVTDARRNPVLRVAVAHLDTRAPLAQGWYFGGPAARNRQAGAVAAALESFSNNDGVPFVLGADLNTQFGLGEGAVDTISKVIARADCGKASTHVSGLLLDHMFVRLPHASLPPQCLRIDDTFGSDHYPLMLPLEFPR